MNRWTLHLKNRPEITLSISVYSINELEKFFYYSDCFLGIPLMEMFQQIFGHRIKDNSFSSYRFSDIFRFLYVCHRAFILFWVNDIVMFHCSCLLALKQRNDCSAGRR